MHNLPMLLRPNPDMSGEIITLALLGGVVIGGILVIHKFLDAAGHLPGAALGLVAGAPGALVGGSTTAIEQNYTTAQQAYPGNLAMQAQYQASTSPFQAG